MAWEKGLLRKKELFMDCNTTLCMCCFFLFPHSVKKLHIGTGDAG